MINLHLTEHQDMNGIEEHLLNSGDQPNKKSKDVSLESVTIILKKNR